MVSMGITASRLNTFATKPYLAARLCSRSYLTLYISKHRVDEKFSPENSHIKRYKGCGVDIQSFSLIPGLVPDIYL